MGVTAEQIEREMAERGQEPTGGLSDVRSRVEGEMRRRGLLDAESGEPLPPREAGMDPNLVPALGETEGEKSLRRARRAGVATDRGAPASARAAASFGVDERAMLRGLQMNLSEYFREQEVLGKNEEVEVRQGPESQRLEYRDPRTDQWALVNPPGMDLGDFASLSGDAVVVIPDVAATVGVSIFTANPVAGITAGSAGAFAGEYARLLIGQAMGVHDLDHAAMMKRARTVAGWSAAGGAAGLLGARIAKGVGNFLSGRTVVPDRHALRDADMDEAAEVAKEVNRRIGTQRLKYTSAQASNDPDLLSIEEAFRQNQRFGALGRFREHREEQIEALHDFWRNINTPYTRQTTEGKAATGRQIQAVAEREQEAARQTAREPAEAAEREARETVETMPTRPGEEVGGSLRQSILDEQEGYRQWAKARAAELDRMADGAAIENRATAEAVTELDEQTQQALFPNLEAPQRKLLSDKLKEGERFTFSQYWSAVSALDRQIRIAEKGLTADTPDIGVLKKLRGALESDAERSLQGTPLGETFDTFRTTVRSEKDRLDRSLVADLAGTEERVFKIPEERVFNTAFERASERDAGIIAGIVGKDPQVAQAWREAVFDAYKRRVIGDDGTVNMTRHNKFMDDHGRKLALFFPERDVEQLRKAGALQRRVEELAARREQTFTELQKTFPGRIESLEPKALFNRLWGNDPDPGEIRQTADLLKNDPEVLDAFRAEVLRDMGQRITSREGQTQALSFKKLDSYLFGRDPDGIAGREGALRALFGDQYVEDVLTLHRAIQIAQREAVSPQRPGTAPALGMLMDLTRAYVGLFTRAGRVVTAMRRMGERGANRVIVDALLEPERMRQLAELKELKPGSKKAAEIMGELGGLWLASPELPEEPEASNE